LESGVLRAQLGIPQCSRLEAIAGLRALGRRTSAIGPPLVLCARWSVLAGVWARGACNGCERNGMGVSKVSLIPDANVRVAACRFVSVRAGRVFEVLRFVLVRVKIRLRVTRFVSYVSKVCLRVMRVGNRVLHCVFVCLCVSCLSCVTRVRIVVTRVACHVCLDRLRFGSCPCHVLACLRFVFVFACP
jgi:hypothetical protein